MTSATLKLTAPGNGRFVMKQAKFDEDGACISSFFAPPADGPAVVDGPSLECVEEWLVLQNLPRDAEFRIGVPHTHGMGADGIVSVPARPVVVHAR